MICSYSLVKMNTGYTHSAQVLEPVVLLCMLSTTMRVKSITIKICIADFNGGASAGGRWGRGDDCGRGDGCVCGWMVWVSVCIYLRVYGTDKKLVGAGVSRCGGYRRGWLMPEAEPLTATTTASPGFSSRRCSSRGLNAVTIRTENNGRDAETTWLMVGTVRVGVWVG